MVECLVWYWWLIVIKWCKYASVNYCIFTLDIGMSSSCIQNIFQTIMTQHYLDPIKYYLVDMLKY